MAVITGIASAGYIYTFRFDSFSEDQLTTLSFFWILAIVFGTYGLIIHSVINTAESSENAGFGKALVIWMESRPPLRSNAIIHLLFSIYTFPLVLASWLTRNKNPMVVLMIGTLFWLVLLKFFYEQIFILL
jgi:hypothetical protein